MSLSATAFSMSCLSRNISRTVDDGVDAVFEGFHRRKGLKRVAQQNHRRMAALAAGHGLQRLKREVFVNGVRAEKFLDDDDLIMKLAETHDEIGVRGGGVNLVTEFLQGGFRGFEPFRRGKGKQRRFVVGADEIKRFGHNLFRLLEFECAGGRRAGADMTFHFQRVQVGGDFLRATFLTLSIARATTPRLVQ